MKRSTTSRVDDAYQQLLRALRPLQYTSTDVKTVLRDYLVAEALGKPYLGLEKAIAIVPTQTKPKRQRLRVVQQDASLRVEADGEFLALVMQEFLPKAVAIAKTSGSCVFLVRDAKTSPLPALYSYLGTREDMIVLQTSYLPINALALHPASQPIMGTNPFSLASPLGNNKAFVFDSAVSEQAAAKMQPGEDILPFGGMKGFNIGVFGLLLAGVANHENGEILQRNDYATRKEASFCYILLSNPLLVNQATQQQSTTMLSQITERTNGHYTAPGASYKQALTRAERLLDNIG